MKSILSTALRSLAVMMVAMGSAQADNTARSVAIDPVYADPAVGVDYEAFVRDLAIAAEVPLTITPVVDYPTFWKDMKRDGDLVAFESPHLAAYRVRERGFAPIACAERETTVSVVVAPSSWIRSVDDLRGGHTVGTLRAPSMSVATLVENLSDPFDEPTIQTSYRSFHDLVVDLAGHKIEAASIPTEYASQRLETRTIFTSKPAPLGVASVSLAMDDAERGRLANALVRDGKVRLSVSQSGKAELVGFHACGRDELKAYEVLLARIVFEPQGAKALR